MTGSGIGCHSAAPSKLQRLCGDRTEIEESARDLLRRPPRAAFEDAYQNVVLTMTSRAPLDTKIIAMAATDRSSTCPIGRRACAGSVH